MYRCETCVCKLPTSPSGTASGDGGDDGELVALGDLCVGAVEVADVLVALVHVDEGAELAVAGVEVLPEVRVLGSQVPERLACGPAVDLHLGVSSGVLSQRRWDLDLRHQRLLCNSNLLSALLRSQSGRPLIPRSAGPRPRFHLRRR